MKSRSSDYFLLLANSALRKINGLADLFRPAAKSSATTDFGEME